MTRLRVYLSSTFEDLKDYRAATFSALERAGLDVARMEAYTATDMRPVDLCLRDVADSDVLIGIYAWRYGYEPPAHHDNPQRQSITELEYRQAERCKIRRLVFLAHPETKAQWPTQFVDESTGAGAGGAKVSCFRAEVGTELTAGMFRSPHELAVLVLASLMRTGLTGRLYNIPAQRAGVVPRLGLIDAVSAAIVGNVSSAGTNTLVFGGGGFGKTTVALSACHSPIVVKAFPDGLLWVALGDFLTLRPSSAISTWPSLESARRRPVRRPSQSPWLCCSTSAAAFWLSTTCGAAMTLRRSSGLGAPACW